MIALRITLIVINFIVFMYGLSLFNGPKQSLLTVVIVTAIGLTLATSIFDLIMRQVQLSLNRSIKSQSV